MPDPKPLLGYEWIEEHARAIHRATGHPLVVSPEVYRTVYGAPKPTPLPPEVAQRVDEAMRKGFGDG